MAIPLLQIPGNIKQQFLPFVIDPNSKLHEYVGSSIDLNNKNISPQFFTYRLESAKAYSSSSGVAPLRFYPASINDIKINNDISFRLLYPQNEFQQKIKNKSLTIDDVLNCIPGISIREFLPDTRLDQCINMFVDLISNMTKLFTDDKASASTQGSSTKTNDKNAKTQQTDEDSWANKFKKIMAATWYTMKYMVGATDPNFFDDLQLGANLPFNNYNTDIVKNTSGKKSPGFYVMTFPYALYYRLQSCVTTNVYEIPATISEKRIISSNGSAGWTDGGSDFMSAGGLRISGLLNKIPVIGSMANMILGNIGVNYMPWWNAETGSKTQEPEISIKFDLFNDNANSALWNFIFVNTIVPNNKWLQYNMFQHSSNLYDVKIEGINRLFACAGDFSVTYEGVLRDPPQTWIDTLKGHLNLNINKENFVENAQKNRLIKIPDVYRVELKFKSLLPANFNNYIFAYTENANHMTKYSKEVYDQSIVAEALPKAIQKYTERVANVYKTGNIAEEDKITKAENDRKAEKAKADAYKQKQQQQQQQQQAYDDAGVEGGYDETGQYDEDAGENYD